MAIHFISGKPGAGKSMLAVKRMLTELRSGKRNIVTNLPLHVGRLNEYLQQKYPGENLNVLQRLRVLKEDEARQFWKYRGPAASTAYDGLTADTPFNALGGEAGTLGVLYILDELHLFFNARDWVQTGRDCLHYLSQHRKLGDTILAVTQSVPNVDKQFRSVAQDFTVVRNEYTAKYWIFRGRGRFVWKSFLSEPTGGGSQVPFEEGTFTLDAKGVASCYDTAQGVGVQGGSADKGARAKGIPVMWVIPMMIGVASLCGIVPWLLGKGTQKFLAGGASEKVAAASAKMPGASADGSPRANSGQPASTGPALGLREPEPAPVSASARVWVTGWVIVSGKINIALSDGRTLTEESEIQRVERNRVVMRDGSVYWRGIPPPPQNSGAGAGAQGAPVRQDAPAPAAVLAAAPAGVRPGAGSPAVAVIQSPSPSPAHPAESPPGAWRLDTDGVQRLREAPTLLGAASSLPLIRR